MVSDIKHIVEGLLKESTSFNSNDVLVHAPIGQHKLFETQGRFEFSLQEFPKSILRETQKTKKESGINSLCLVTHTVALNTGQQRTITPVVLMPLRTSINKLKGEITFEPFEEDAFINPYLLRFLELEASVDTSQYDVNTILEQLNELELTVEQRAVIGNFHHHRFQVVKELEELLHTSSYSNGLLRLVGAQVENPEVRIGLDLPKDTLFPADTDHLRVFETIKVADTVIQGPPGTGKSQALTNILGKLLAANETTIVVSEKHAALDVLKKKLSHFGLDHLCYIASSDQMSHSFLQELKATWDYFESYSVKPETNLRLSEQYLSNLQLTLDMLSNQSLIGGVSLHDFTALSQHLNLEKQAYSSKVDSISSFLTIKTTIQQTYDSGFNDVVGLLKKDVLFSDSFHSLDQKIEQWISQLKILKSIFQFNTWESFKQVQKEAALCQVYENELYKKHSSIFKPNSRTQKRFLNLRKKYLKSRAEIDALTSNRSEWKIVPSETETKVLLESLQQGGFFTKSHAKRRWKTLSNLPFHEAIPALEMHLISIGKINAFSQLTINFCELGLENPETDIDLIHHTLNAFTVDEWQKLAEIPVEKRSAITGQHKVLSDLYHDLKAMLNLHAETPLFSSLVALQNSFGKIVAVKSDLSQLSDAQLDAFNRSTSFRDYEGELYASHWAHFKDHFPQFSQFTIGDLSSKISDVIVAHEKEALMFARQVEYDAVQRFKAAHEILNTPARKLTEDQKLLKARLRKGKSILVKEFAKTRSHPTLRELNNSEVREWIQLLKPIWLSNPVQLAKCFPLEQELFSVAIFDEASQIPLQNALGTIQRSKRVIIAGDEHQMGPTNYFKSGSSEPVDLLHQANYHFSRVGLKHHYRSIHPDLISFSNTHFYSNELRAYPGCSPETPIRHHFIEDGRFIDRKNEKEAQQIAVKVKALISSNGTLGIVAFSEEQLHCIRQALDPTVYERLKDRIEDNTAFFKALENVQGDECDHLIISLGYGKNEDEEFHLRFGPLNTARGRNRLNVLFTRAIKTIDFFTSVKAADFKMSDNESINLLRQWIRFTEQFEENKTLPFPFGLDPQINGNQVTFDRIQTALPNAQELVTLHQVLTNRGWSVNYS